MKLILHIGTEKTGTTATQRWAARNRDALLRQGVRYSQVLGQRSHINLYLWCLTPGRGDDGFNRINISSESERREFRARLPDEFATEVSEAKKSGCHTFLISSEHCHSRLIRHKEVERAREFLEPHFDEIEVTCCLRPQIDLAVSVASNVAKWGNPITRAYFESVTPESSYYDYKTLADRWSAAFGAEKLRLVPFRRTPDVTEIIAARGGIDITDLQPPVRSNEALGVGVMAMTNAIKAQPRDARWTEPFAYIPLEVLHLLPREQRLQPGLELAKAVQARFEENNADLTNSRADIEMADLEPDWSRYDAPGNLDLLERPCAFSAELAALVQLFNQNIALARAQNEIQETERHLESRHPVIAQRHLKAGLHYLALLKQAEISGQRLRRLQARADSLMEQLDGSRDRPARGWRVPSTPRRGRKRDRADDESGASDASATGQDLT
jgi:hypothetical protein